MSWEAHYKKALMTEDDALACVESGMRVYIQPGDRAYIDHAVVVGPLTQADGFAQ
jgi:hypothetical protein